MLDVREFTGSPGILALVYVHTPPLCELPHTLQPIVTILVPVTAECLVTTPGVTFSRDFHSLPRLTSSPVRGTLSCSTCLPLQTRIFPHFVGTCPEDSIHLHHNITYCRDDITLTPGDAVLGSALVIPAPGQAVTVRGARALAVAAGPSTRAPPLATVVLNRQNFVKHTL